MDIIKPTIGLLVISLLLGLYSIGGLTNPQLRLQQQPNQHCRNAVNNTAWHLQVNNHHWIWEKCELGINPAIKYTELISDVDTGSYPKLL